jgi:oligopeptide/dipeptide ABC transporter ATP-binding protein
MSLLAVEDLGVSFRTEDGTVHAVRDLSFTLEAGATLGIVGESGSGKSVTAQTLMGLTQGATLTGQVRYDGRDLLQLPNRDLRRIRGAEIAMIFQDPLSSLHPHYKVGWQIAEMIRAHTNTSRRDARTRAADLLGLVGIPQPARRIDDYPHQFSGGMRQRVMIAMALALDPKVLIADEPTTALDVTIQAQIIELIQRLQREFNTALIMITHDLGVVAEIADDVLVMYAGRGVVQTNRESLFYSPHHPYTQGLINSIPNVASLRERLRPIPGQPPSLIDLPSGCSFRPRCTFSFDRCVVERPPLRPVGPDVTNRAAHEHVSACWLPANEVGLESHRTTA